MKKLYLRDFILENGGDGMMLYSSYNRFWLTGIESSFAIIFMNKLQEIIYITDARYDLAAKTHLKNETNVTVWCLNKDGTLKELIDRAIKQLNIKQLLIEKDYLNLDQLELVKQYSYHAVESSWIRAIKTDDEIEKLQKAADIIVDVINWVWTWIKPGYSEKEVAKKISIKILELGASGNSFDPIVAANINGASPHHHPSEYIIQDGDMVTIDLGCVYDNYTSDMTRTFVVGEKCNQPEMLKIYEIVKTAQLKGIEKSVVNQTTGDVDAACRSYIGNTEYKTMFNHGTGHGVGIQVHEKPVASPNQTTILKNNHVITVEPGIYKENVGGVRIEDTIVIKDNQPLILTRGITKDLVFIKNK